MEEGVSLKARAMGEMAGPIEDWPFDGRRVVSREAVVENEACFLSSASVSVPLMEALCLADQASCPLVAVTGPQCFVFEVGFPRT